MENTVIKERLSLLRDEMKSAGIDHYMIPTSDYHDSEYVAPFFRVREYFSNFTGSAGTLVVGADGFAGLWTDGRYFIQAEKELEGTGITLFRQLSENVPTLEDYLKENMKKGTTLGFDGMTLNASVGELIGKKLKENEILFKHDTDLAALIWKDRPALPCSAVYVLDDEISGRTFKDKLSDVRARMAEAGAKMLVLSRLDDICWLMNIRGSDVECNPVVLSYCVVTETSCTLFIQDKALSPESADYLKGNGITIKNYHDIISYLRGVRMDVNVLADKGGISYTLYSILKEKTKEEGGKVLNLRSPTTVLKAVKNETELKNLREVFLKDSVALTKFMRYVKTSAVADGMDEYTLAEKIDAMRAAIPGFIELSFDTISAYGENAAMMHYTADEESAAKIEAKGMYLVDSGGTYMGGTTDVTRTIVMGEISDEMKKHYTLTAVGMLRLANARFLSGSCGKNLDVLARGPLWNEGIDYKCGTGHGIGYMLNVHEGPHNIRFKVSDDAGHPEPALEEGMIVTDEPGVYIEGSHGIRIENVLEVVSDITNSDGTFLKFWQLTYAPIDLDAIDVRYMQPSDVEALNEYHAAVFEKVSPLIGDEETVEWLREQTRPLEWKAG